MRIRDIIAVVLLSASASALSVLSSDRSAPSQGLRDEVARVIANHWVHEEQESISLRRNLGDFDELNSLFDGLVIGLPDLYLEAGKFLGATIRLWVTNMECFALSVDDLIIDYRKSSNTLFDFEVDIQGLAISCELNWSYKWSFADGSGRAQVYTSKNNADTKITFSSQGFDQYPPSGSAVSECNAFIEIDDMDFQGGIVASFVDTFERSLRSTVENEINAAACQELGSLGTTLVVDMLDSVYGLIEKYLGTLPPEYEDVLNTENLLEVPQESKVSTSLKRWDW